ncbi:hypothetical protein [Sphingomonas sp. PAMC 26621]|uniref:hypothetical protein n=1 Tax=Sphingomonas sp. PAMC 26621 TaxID=1112213 RepID=UPI00028A062B|nr:hypothetical protein [Sphingomonas sp. PAMC 26621]
MQERFVGDENLTDSLATMPVIIASIAFMLILYLAGNAKFATIYVFNKSEGRSRLTDASTKIGRQISGKPFTVHMIGSKPFSARRRR